MPNRKLILGEIYRVPGTHEGLSIERYQSVVNYIRTTYPTHDVVIGTDQNFDYVKVNSHASTANLLDVFLAGGLLPVINKPTRITHRSATCIDNIYVQFSAGELKTAISAIITTDISDHLPILFSFGTTQRSKKIPITFTCRPIDNQKIDAITETLREQDWNYLDNLSVEEAYDSFISVVLNAVNKYAPEKQITIPYKRIIREPWFTKGFMKSSRTRDRMYQKCMNKNPDDCDRRAYIKYRNLYNKSKRIAKQMYYNNLLEENKNDIKKHGLSYMN